MRPHCAIRFLLGIATWVTVIPSAVASPTFPAVVQQTLHLPAAPDCTLCHGLGQTGYRTVTTTSWSPFDSRSARDHDRACSQELLADGASVVRPQERSG